MMAIWWHQGQYSFTPTPKFYIVSIRVGTGLFLFQISQTAENMSILGPVVLYTVCDKSSKGDT